MSQRFTVEIKVVRNVGKLNEISRFVYNITASNDRLAATMARVRAWQSGTDIQSVSVVSVDI